MATPAAVLSIMVRAQGVQATSTQLTALDKNARKAGTGLAATEKHAKRSGTAFSAMGTAAKSAGILVGAAGLAAGLKLANSEYREAQKVGAQTTAVLKSTGNAAKVTKKHIEDLAGAISQKSGIDDEAIQSGSNLLLTFKGIRNEQGKGNKIFDQATQVITDMSVSLKQGLKPSAIQVGKALNDPIQGMTALKRVGVTFTDAQKKTITSLQNSGHTLEAQKLILKELTSEFGGSAAAQATAGDKLKVAWNNLAEAAGGVLVPALDKVATFLTKVINQAVKGEGIAKFIVPAFNEIKRSGADLVAVIGPFVQTVGPQLITFFQGLPGPVKQATIALAGLAVVFSVGSPLMAGIAAFALAAITIRRNWGTIGPAIQHVRDTVSAWVTKNQADIQIVLKAFSDVGKVVKAVFEVAFPVAVGIAKRTLSGLATATSGALQLVRGAITTFLALLHGDWSRAWGGLKDIAAGGIKLAYGAVKAGTAPFREIGSRIVSAVVDGLSLLGHTILNKFKDAANFVISNVGGLFKGVGSKIAGGVGKINPFGDGLGKLPKAGKGSAALLGANSSLGPIAGIGSSFGLHVSSGRRPGAITSSGNVSYHSTGEAIDEAGPPAGMMAFFQTMKSKYGSRLAELIYGPGKVGIKNGQPYNFGSALNAQHMDHVHVALDTGKPGPGDGIGRAAGARKALTGDGLGGSNARLIWQYLRSKGFTPAQAAGIMGNLSQESGFNPGAKQPGGPGRGIAQWGGGRFKALQAFAKRRGKPWNDLGTQLDFMMSELRGPENMAMTALQGAHTVADATQAFGSKYERYGIAGDRLGPAQAAFKAFKGLGGTAAQQKKAAAAKVNPFEQKLASADLAIAQTKSTGSTKVGGVGGRRVSNALAAAGAIRAKEKVIGARIKKIRAALKGKLSPTTRLRLTQELAQRLGEHTDLDKQATALLHPAATAGAGGDVGSVSSGDTGTGDGEDPNQPLIDAINAAAVIEQERIAAMQAHTDAITALNDQIKTQNSFAIDARTVEMGQLARGLADFISGQIGGYGGAGGRALTAGAGSVARY